jgi:hypothetical protein
MLWGLGRKLTIDIGGGGPLVRAAVVCGYVKLKRSE